MNKHIEEFTEDLCEIQNKGMKCAVCDTGCECRMLAEALYNAGYRKQSEDCEKRIANQREELRRLRKRINDLTQSRDVWKKQAERVGKQLNEVLSKQSEGEWVKDEKSKFKHRYHCSACNFYLIGAPTKH